MMINGRFYHDPEIQCHELALAVNRLPIDAPIRAHFEFLFGYIDALFIEIDEAETSADELVEARSTIATISELINRRRTNSKSTTATTQRNGSKRYSVVCVE
jgi:hypothetical protein